MFMRVQRDSTVTRRGVAALASLPLLRDLTLTRGGKDKGKNKDKDGALSIQDLLVLVETGDESRPAKYSALYCESLPRVPLRARRSFARSRSLLLAVIFSELDADTEAARAVCARFVARCHPRTRLRSL